MNLADQGTSQKLITVIIAMFFPLTTLKEWVSMVAAGWYKWGMVISFAMIVHTSNINVLQSPSAMEIWKWGGGLSFHHVLLTQ